ncbi:unnamed protein product [Phytophthora fragariaefolia]|uniref:Unnamed protein product n=1 Tax=Phytophthora fragariaefolia TaxID=1490495 RepID=A0A9W6TJP1_9STRA|nr:unnamed protein product [Phytophthora fragariaefolia]
MGDGAGIKLAERGQNMDRVRPSEYYKLYEDTVKFVKSKHDKDSVPSELQGIYSSNLSESARQLAVSESFAQKLRLRRRVSLGKKIDIQGIAKDKVYTQERAKVKLTLGWELVYEFEFWIIPHYAGVDAFIGIDFMIPAGVRLDFGSTMKNLEQVVVPLIKFQREVDKQSSAKHVPGSPNDALDWKQLDELTGTDDGTENGVINEVSSNQASSSISVEVNASSCPTRVGPRHLPRWNGRRHGAGVCHGSWSAGYDDEITDSTTDDPLAGLHLRYAASADALMKDMDSPNDGETEYEGNEIHFEDYAHELAFLPDLTVPASTILEYDAPNVKNTTLGPIAQLKLVEILRQHEEIMIASGNALPPPAYGVVCDIAVRDHAPIKQRARRIPLKYLRKLYELLKGLLEEGLIAFLSRPWASPIVIVLKRN